jgi:hypothetical protein
LLAVLFTAAGCGGTTTTTIVGPSGSRCEISVRNDTPEVPASGGDGTLTVASERECSWSAAAEASWITLRATSGQGPATVNYSVLPNPNGTPRRGRVVVSEQAVEVIQAASPCRYEVSPAASTVDASQHQVSINLSAPGGCQWRSRSEVPWITNVEPAEGVGNATVRFTVAPNTSEARAGTVAIGDATVRINQSGAGPAPSPGPAPAPTCTYNVSPARHTVSSAGDQVEIALATQPGCTWVARSDAPWIGILSSATGSGTGSVRLAVSGNNGGARTGTVSIANRTVTIEQEPPAPPAPPACTYRLAQPARNIGGGAEEFNVGVDAPAACTWTATSTASWIAVTDSRIVSGSASFRLSVERNTGGARSGTVRVATETFTVNQAAGECTYSIKPTYYNAGRGPDDIIIEVTAPNGCAWTTRGDPSWVTVSAGRTGSGNGTVRLLIPANTGAPRTALLTIAEQTFTLHQEGPCISTIKPGHYNAGRGPDDIRIEVTADTGCSWTAASSVTWVRVAEGATGTGNGTVRLLVEPNSGAARSVTLTIAGQPFELRQNGSQ